MHESGCTATFSRDQRQRFLDSKTIEKLERLQQQDEIRKAELPNLSTCPFCDFAAICPPVEEDREFRCHNPECAEVSCRLCKLKSHIPLTCEESKKENGVSERRVIEEARTEALIRTCGKCKIRILKEDGCNKVICTSCYAVLCDYCGKDITKAMYNHFDGQGRAPPGLITAQGGKCPLYDESSKRKDQQVDQAEKDAMSKVRAEHPELSEEDLKIKFAKSVQSSTDPDSRVHHRYHRMMRDIHGAPLRDLGFAGLVNGPDPMPMRMARYQAVQRDDQHNAGAVNGRAEELHNELREQQAAVQLAHQNLQQQHRQAQHRQIAERGRRLQEVQRNQQRRAQLDQVRIHQRRQDLAPVVAIPPAEAPLVDFGNFEWGAPLPDLINDNVNNPLGFGLPLFNAEGNAPGGRRGAFHHHNGPNEMNWNDFGDPPPDNPANLQPVQYGNRDQNVVARAQELNARQQRLAQARVAYPALQPPLVPEPQQPQQQQYEPWLGDFIHNGPELDAWNVGPPAPQPNNQPPAAAYDWQN